MPRTPLGACYLSVAPGRRRVSNGRQIVVRLADYEKNALDGIVTPYSGEVPGRSALA
jgi:hypothetical protein